MKMKSVRDANLNGKRILLRVDFNVEIEKGNTKEKFKVEASRETINYILAQKGTKLALISHLGRPSGKFDSKYSLRQIMNDLGKILGKKIKFNSDCVGEEVRNNLENLREGEILLLENVRFYPGEEKNDPGFAKSLAENFDVFVNDAFSVCHRDQASVTGVAKILPAFAGIRLEKEIAELEKVKSRPAHPAVAIIGGAKIETKLPLINAFEKNYDYVLVGSKIALEAKERSMSFSEKIIFPVDYSGGGLDIGEETVKKFKEIISTAKTVVWNGPMGKFEEPPYDRGTKEIMEAIIVSGAFSVVGGGESLEVLEENGTLEKFSFVSTGGGAMLEYLGGNLMPGMEALRVI